MDSHSIFNYRTLFSALSSIFLFFSVLSFSSAWLQCGSVYGKKNRICRAGRPCFFENFRLS